MRPQKKNPHRFTIDQHVFPAASIERFADSNGRVSLFDIRRNKLRCAKPSDARFCAKRAWDHSAETQFMKRIEDNFQALASKIIAGATLDFDVAEKQVAHLFYALWHTRSRKRTLSTTEIQAVGFLGSSEFTPEQEENLEKNGYMVARADGKFLAHQLNAVQIQVETGRVARSLKETSWGIVHAHKGEFIVPDAPSHTIIPITPTLCLMNQAASGIITEDNVALVNRMVRSTSLEYFFSRDIERCPF